MHKQKGFIVPAVLLGIAIVSAVASGVLWYETKKETKLGRTAFVGGERYRLAGSGVSGSETSITLSSFTYGPNDVELLMADFGDIGYLTIEPGTGNKEFVSFTAISQNANNTQATVTGVTRGLNFVSPYAASTSLQIAHPGGSTVIISNPPQLYNRAVFQDNTATITAIFLYNTSTAPRYNATTTWSGASTTIFAPIDYVNNVASSGAADASFSVKGLVELATQQQFRLGTEAGDDTSALLVPRNSWFSSTSTATTTGVVTRTTGLIAPGFIDYAASSTYTGANTFVATTTFSSTTSLTGTTNFTGAINASGTNVLQTATINGNLTVGGTVSGITNIVDGFFYDLQHASGTYTTSGTCNALSSSAVPNGLGYKCVQLPEGATTTQAAVTTFYVPSTVNTSTLSIRLVYTPNAENSTSVVAFVFNSWSGTASSTDSLHRQELSGGLTAAGQVWTYFTIASTAWNGLPTGQLWYLHVIGSRSGDEVLDTSTSTLNMSGILVDY